MDAPVTPPPSPSGLVPAGEGLSFSSPSPRRVAILNLILISVGYFVIGQWKKGIAMLALGAVVLLLTLGYGLPLLAIFTAVDGHKLAHRLRRGEPVRQWSWLNRP